MYKNDKRINKDSQGKSFCHEAEFPLDEKILIVNDDRRISTRHLNQQDTVPHQIEGDEIPSQLKEFVKVHHEDLIHNSNLHT